MFHNHSILRVLLPFVLTACGVAEENMVDAGSSSQVTAKKSAEGDGSAGAVRDFVAHLKDHLAQDPRIAAVWQSGALDSVFGVDLAQGTRITIKRRNKNGQPISRSVFSDLRVATVEPTDGRDASCLLDGLQAAADAGYEPLYVGPMFSETTLFIGLSSDESLAYDLSEASCFTSWTN